MFGPSPSLVLYPPLGPHPSTCYAVHASHSRPDLGVTMVSGSPAAEERTMDNRFATVVGSNIERGPFVQ